MSLNFIDISMWQKGLDLKSLFSLNPELGGVIVKSSGGVSNIQNTCDPWVQWLMEHNKPWGFYHYLDDDFKNSSGRAEAEFWVKNCRSYFGKGMPWADYEENALNMGTGYLKEFLDTVYSLTGVKCGVYCSQSVTQSQDFSAIASAGYPLWMAQYADMAVVYGFIEKPWQKGSVSPFDRYVMHQYTGNGRLNGYSSPLDMDKFYGTAEDWKKMVSGKSVKQNDVIPIIVPTRLKDADPTVVLDVLNGKYGIEQNRVNGLRAAGYDPDSVQRKINELYGVCFKVKNDIGGNMSYLNAILKIIKSL